MTWYTTIRSTTKDAPVVTIVEADDGTFTALGDTIMAKSLQARVGPPQSRIDGKTADVRAWQWIGTASAPYLKADPSTEELPQDVTVQPTPEAFLADAAPADDTGDARHVSRETSRAAKAVRQLTKLRQSLGTRLIAMSEQAYEAALTQAGGRVKGRARSRLSKARQAEATAAVEQRHPLRSWLGAVGITELEMLHGSFDTFADNARAEFIRYATRVAAAVERSGIDVPVTSNVDAAVDYLVAALTAQTRRRLLIGDEAMLAAAAPRMIPRARRPNPAAYDTLGLPDPEELAAAAARLVSNATAVAEGRAMVTYPVTPDEMPTVDTLDDQPRVEERVAAVVNVAPVWTWRHGFYGEPRTVFKPHDDLDDFTTTDRDNDPGLANDEAWPEGAVYAPLDHDGCTCEWVIEPA